MPHATVPVAHPLYPAASTARRRHHLTDNRHSALEGIALGILLVLLMQFRPFRLAVYALFAWGAFLWVQDRWSEHTLPDDTPALAWSLEGAEPQPVFADDTRTWRVAIRAQNRGAELLQEATLVGTLYECSDPDAVLAACTPVDRSRDRLPLDLPPGFVHHLSVYPAFQHSGATAFPRATWRVSRIVADSDAAG